MDTSIREHVPRKGTKYTVYVHPDATLAHVKDQLAHATGVLAHRQKLLGRSKWDDSRGSWDWSCDSPVRPSFPGLVKSKLPPDNISLRDLEIHTGKSFMMMGSTEQDVLAEPDDIPEVTASGSGGQL